MRSVLEMYASEIWNGKHSALVLGWTDDQLAPVVEVLAPLLPGHLPGKPDKRITPGMTLAIVAVARSVVVDFQVAGKPVRYSRNCNHYSIPERYRRGDQPPTCQRGRERPEEVTGVISGFVWLAGHHLTAPREVPMDELNEDMLMGLPEFRKLTHLSPSSERRMRTSEEDWPPHLVLGRKVFYVRQGVRDYLDRQQSVGAAGQGCGPEPGSMNVPGEDVCRRLAGLGSAAPKFSTGQLAWLRAVLAVAEGDEVSDVDDPRGGADHRREVGR